MWKEFRKQRIAALDEAIDKKKVDSEIVQLLEKINLNPDLVTTSSCFGRITLLEFDLNKRKKQSSFYRKWHSKVDLEEVEMAASSHDGKMPLWFKVEPFILHVSAKDYAAAEAFMLRMRAAGVKRGGIQGAMKDKVPIEVQGTVWMSVPIDAVEPRWEQLVAIANKMMAINAAQVRKLEKIKW